MANNNGPQIPPLILAARESDAGEMDRLIQEGADVRTTWEGHDVLDEVAGSFLDGVTVLISNGFSVSQALWRDSCYDPWIHYQHAIRIGLRERHRRIDNLLQVPHDALIDDIFRIVTEFAYGPREEDELKGLDMMLLTVSEDLY